MYWDLSFTVTFGLIHRLQTVLNRTGWKWGNYFAKRDKGLLIFTGSILILCPLLVNVVNDAGEDSSYFLNFGFPFATLLFLNFLNRNVFKKSKNNPQSSQPWKSFCYVECKEKDEKHNPSQNIKNKLIHSCLENILEAAGFEWETHMFHMYLLILGCIGLNRRKKWI